MTVMVEGDMKESHAYLLPLLHGNSREREHLESASDLFTPPPPLLMKTKTVGSVLNQGGQGNSGRSTTIRHGGS